MTKFQRECECLHTPLHCTVESRYVRVGVLRDVTRFLKSDWFALYAVKGTVLRCYPGLPRACVRSI